MKSTESSIPCVKRAISCAKCMISDSDIEAGPFLRLITFFWKMRENPRNSVKAPIARNPNKITDFPCFTRVSRQLKGKIRRFAYPFYLLGVEKALLRSSYVFQDSHVFQP